LVSWRDVLPVTADSPDFRTLTIGAGVLGAAVFVDAEILVHLGENVNETTRFFLGNGCRDENVTIKRAACRRRR